MKSIKILLILSLLVNAALGFVIASTYTEASEKAPDGKLSREDLLSKEYPAGTDPFSILSPSDSMFVERVVAVYDGFVWEHTDHSLSIGDAYRDFFAKAPADLQPDFSYFIPSQESLKEFWDDFISRKIFTQLATPQYISYDYLGNKTAGWEMAFLLHKKGLFIDFMGLQGLQNPIWIDMLDAAMSSGKYPSPISLANLYHNRADINFDDKAERFLTALVLINIVPNPGPDNEFVMKQDLGMN